MLSAAGTSSGGTSSLARVPSPDQGYSSNRDKETRIYALIKLERGKKNQRDKTKIQPWTLATMARASQVTVFAARSPEDRGMAAPPNSAEQGRTVPHMVLLLVMPPQRKGLGRP